MRHGTPDDGTQRNAHTGKLATRESYKSRLGVLVRSSGSHTEWKTWKMKNVKEKLYVKKND